MIGSLMEIQIAYNMMDVKTAEDSVSHPLDTHYLKLNCAIDVCFVVVYSYFNEGVHVFFFLGIDVRFERVQYS